LSRTRTARSRVEPQKSCAMLSPPPAWRARTGSSLHRRPTRRSRYARMSHGCGPSSAYPSRVTSTTCTRASSLLRQDELEPGALLERLVEQVATVCARVGAGDGEAEAAAGRRLRAGEALEQPRAEILRHAGTLVLDAHAQVP